MDLSQCSEVRRIGDRTFTEEDQLFFARASGDINPMHVSATAARRLITGKLVVHGIHILMSAIECWQNDGDVAPISIRCSFDNPVSVGDRVLFTQRCRRDREFVVEATVNSLVCARVMISLEQRKRRSPSAETVEVVEVGGVEHAIDPHRGPLDETPARHRNITYLVRLGHADLSEAFPRSCHYFGGRRVAAMLALSFFVGMVCPGLHSIFSSLDLDLGSDSGLGDSLAFQVDSYDDRFRLFDISVAGSIAGSIGAFLRPVPQTQPTLQEIADSVNQGEFKGTRSLVVGGSRGLGETTAKIIAAGGGDVVISYARGVDEVTIISKEINAVGSGRCEILKLDLLTDSFESLNLGVDVLDAVYFFATPRIYRKKGVPFDSQLFREFVRFYVERFEELCAYLEGKVVNRRISVYFPSSVFVSERPVGLTEYSMAKAAAEVLVDDLNRRSKKLSILMSRLPRLRTDQTTSLLTLATGSNVEALLPIVRAIVKGENRVL
jgi:acyl dehydratase